MIECRATLIAEAAPLPAFRPTDFKVLPMLFSLFPVPGGLTAPLRAELLAGFAIAGPLGAPSQAHAQAAWPTKPITVISPFATGGSVDVLTRIVATYMSQSLGQPMVINTLAGAGGTMGAARGAQSAPDGYTLVAGSSGSNAAAYAVYEKLPYKPDDFVQIGVFAIIPALIVVKKDLPVKNLHELVTYAKANPGKLSFGHPGVGSSVHLQCELLKQVAGIDIQMVPYRGAGPLMTDLMGGQIDGACDAPPSSSGPHQAGQIRAIAVLGDQHAPSMMEVQTTVEQQMPALQGSAWVAFFAPRGTPPAVVEKLNRALSAALDNPEVIQRMTKLGTNVPLTSQRSLKYNDDFVKSEIAKWDGVARSAHIPKQ